MNTSQQFARPIKMWLYRITNMTRQYLSYLLAHSRFAHAQSVARDNRPILLSNAERQRFLSQLNASDDPNECLKKAARYYLKEFNSRELGCRVTRINTSSQ